MALEIIMMMMITIIMMMIIIIIIMMMMIIIILMMMIIIIIMMIIIIIIMIIIMVIIIMMIIRIVIIIVKINRMGQIIIGGCNDFTPNNNHYNYNDSSTIMQMIVTSTSILYLRSYINLLQIRDHLLHPSYFLILQIPMCNIFTLL